MATKEEILNAIKIVGDFAGNPDSGIVAQLLKDLETSTVATKEVRTVDAKETR